MDFEGPKGTQVPGHTSADIEGDMLAVEQTMLRQRALELAIQHSPGSAGIVSMAEDFLAFLSGSSNASAKQPEDDPSTDEKATVARSSALDDWFRHVGTQLSNEDYEAGIQAIATRDAEVAELREHELMLHRNWEASYEQLRARLSEAQATIDRALNRYDNSAAQRYRGFEVAKDMATILSAPSSTGGN